MGNDEVKPARDRLIGLWSSGARFGPGSHSCEWLVFKEDGTGFLEMANVVLMFAEWFRWSVDAPGVVTLKGYRARGLSKDGTAVEDEESQLNAEIAFTVAAEGTPRGQRMNVLRLARSPWEYVPNEFGFVRRTDLSNEPDFSATERLIRQPLRSRGGEGPPR